MLSLECLTFVMLVSTEGCSQMATFHTPLSPCTTALIRSVCSSSLSTFSWGELSLYLPVAVWKKFRVDTQSGDRRDSEALNISHMYRNMHYCGWLTSESADVCMWDGGEEQKERCRVRKYETEQPMHDISSTVLWYRSLSRIIFHFIIKK